MAVVLCVFAADAVLLWLFGSGVLRGPLRILEDREIEERPKGGGSGVLVVEDGEGARVLPAAS